MSSSLIRCRVGLFSCFVSRPFSLSQSLSPPFLLSSRRRFSIQSTSTDSPPPRVTNTATSTIVETVHPGTEIKLEVPPSPLDDAPKPPIQDRIKSWINANRRKFKNYGILTGFLLASYESLSFSFSTIEYFLSIGDPAAAELAFLTGIGVSGIGLGLFAVSRRVFRHSATDLYRFLLRSIKKNDRIAKELGGNLRVRHLPLSEMKKIEATRTSPAATQWIRSFRSMAPFRLVNTLNGAPRWSAEPGVKYLGWERYWRPQKTQFIFEIEGDQGAAIVYSEVEKKIFTLEKRVNLCMIQRRDNGERVLIESDKSSWTENVWKQQLFVG